MSSLFPGDRRADGLKKGAGAYGSNAKAEAETKRLGARENSGLEEPSEDVKKKVSDLWKQGRNLAEIQREIGVEIKTTGGLGQFSESLLSGKFKILKNGFAPNQPEPYGDDVAATEQDSQELENGYTKRAWVHGGDQANKPGIGRISCPCGKAPESTFGDGKDVECPCGRKYDSRGNILAGPELQNEDSSATGFQSGQKTTTAQRGDFVEDLENAVGSFKLVEKKNHLAVHGIFDSRERAEQHLAQNIPEYCRKGFFMDKTLTPDSFEIISSTKENSTSDSPAMKAARAKVDALRAAASKGPQPGTSGYNPSAPENVALIAALKELSALQKSEMAKDGLSNSDDNTFGESATALQNRKGKERWDAASATDRLKFLLEASLSTANGSEKQTWDQLRTGTKLSLLGYGGGKSIVNAGEDHDFNIASGMWEAMDKDARAAVMKKAGVSGYGFQELDEIHTPHAQQIVKAILSGPRENALDAHVCSGCKKALDKSEAWDSYDTGKLWCRDCDGSKAQNDPNAGKGGEGDRGLNNADESSLCYDCSHPKSAHTPSCVGCKQKCQHFVKRDSDGDGDKGRENADNKCPKCGSANAYTWAKGGKECNDCGHFEEGPKGIHRENAASFNVHCPKCDELTKHTGDEQGKGERKCEQCSTSYKWNPAGSGKWEARNAANPDCPICDRKGVKEPHNVKTANGKDTCEHCGHEYPKAGDKKDLENAGSHLDTHLCETPGCGHGRTQHGLGPDADDGYCAFSGCRCQAYKGCKCTGDGVRKNASSTRADIVRTASDFKHNGATRASAHDQLEEMFPGMGGDVRMVVDDLWPLHEGHRSNENADAPSRGKCEWCSDPDAPKKKRSDGSIVYQCGKCAEKIQLDNAAEEPVSMGHGWDGGVEPGKEKTFKIPPKPKQNDGLLSPEQFARAWDSASGTFRAARLSDVGAPRNLHDVKWSDVPADLKARLLQANEKNFPSKENSVDLSPSWLAASLEERAAWLEQAGQDINLATETDWTRLSTDVKVALQDEKEEPKSLNNSSDIKARLKAAGFAWTTSGSGDAYIIYREGRDPQASMVADSNISLEDAAKKVLGSRENAVDYGNRAPEFITWVKQIASANGKSESDVFKMWKDYSAASYDQSALTSEFMDANRLKGSDMHGRPSRAQQGLKNADDDAMRKAWDKMVSEERHTLYRKATGLDKGGPNDFMLGAWQSLDDKERVSISRVLQNALSAPWKCDECGANLATDEDVKAHKFDTGHSSYKGKSNENAARFERPCPDCDATGYTEDAKGNDVKCAKCKGSGVEQVSNLKNAAWKEGDRITVSTAKGEEVGAVTKVTPWQDGTMYEVKIEKDGRTVTADTKHITGRANSDDKGPFDQPNDLGCNGCDDIKAPLNKYGYCAECAKQQGPRKNAFTFVDNAGEEEIVEAQNEDEAWAGLAGRMNSTKDEMKALGVKLKNAAPKPLPEGKDPIGVATEKEPQIGGVVGIVPEGEGNVAPKKPEAPATVTVGSNEGSTEGESMENASGVRCSCGGHIEAVQGEDDRYECGDCGMLYEKDDWSKPGNLKLKACAVQPNEMENAADRTIEVADIQAAQRGLNMISMGIPELRDLISEHAAKDMFASKVIVKGAEQMMAAKKRMGAAENSLDPHERLNVGTTLGASKYGGAKTATKIVVPTRENAGTDKDAWAKLDETARKAAAKRAGVNESYGNVVKWDAIPQEVRDALGGVLTGVSGKENAVNPVCPNCEQWQSPTQADGGIWDCSSECAKRGFAPKKPSKGWNVEKGGGAQK